MHGVIVREVSEVQEFHRDLLWCPAQSVADETMFGKQDGTTHAVLLVYHTNVR